MFQSEKNQELDLNNPIFVFYVDVENIWRIVKKISMSIKMQLCGLLLPKKVK